MRIRKNPLDEPPFEKFVLLLADGNHDLWWIDADGDILYWDMEEPPDFPYEVRRTSINVETTDDNETINKAFAESTPYPEFSWHKWAGC